MSGHSRPHVAVGARKADGPQTGSTVPLQPACGPHEGLIADALDRVATHLEEAAALLRKHQNQLAASPERALMVPVQKRRLLTVRDVADRLGIDQKTVRRWRQEGKLPPPIELGGSVLRWDPDRFDDWLEEQQR